MTTGLLLRNRYNILGFRYVQAAMSLDCTTYLLDYTSPRPQVYKDQLAHTFGQ